jgi:hypothetical protein
MAYRYRRNGSATRTVARSPSAAARDSPGYGALYFYESAGIVADTDIFAGGK